MKLAIISDIHGNYEAFKSVLQNCSKFKIDKFIFLGDYVGYYYDAFEVMNKIMSLDAICIKGNHDLMLEQINKGELCSKMVIKQYGHGLSIALQKLNKEHLQFMENLPGEVEVDFDGVLFYFSHIFKYSDDGYIYSDTINKYKNKIIDSGYDFFCVGHSHYPFIYKIKDTTFINPGSVGQSRQNGGVANWCLVDTTTKDAEIMSCEYDVCSLKKQIQFYDPSNMYIRNILNRK